MRPTNTIDFPGWIQEYVEKEMLNITDIKRGKEEERERVEKQKRKLKGMIH